MRIRRYIQLLLVTASLSTTLLPAVDTMLPAPAAIDAAMRLANDHWQEQHSRFGNSGWERSSYMIGNLTAWQSLGEPAWLDYAVGWGERNDWKLANRELEADAQCCGQSYYVLYDHEPLAERTAAIDASIDDLVASERIGSWDWIDALFMAMPTLVHRGLHTGDTAYADRMRDMYLDTRDRQGLFSAELGLWFRDDRYVYPANTSPNGLPICWSRGNGWVIAAMARSLTLLPADHPDRALYADMLQTMAASLRQHQRSDGFWNANLTDPDHHGGRETSGTAFFTYAISFGIRSGLLDYQTYQPVVSRAWNGMIDEALQSDGFLGYVQQVGFEPRSTRRGQTGAYAVGAFLLAGSELRRLAVDGNQAPSITSAASADPAETSAASQLSVTAVDPDGDALSYRWAMLSGPAGAAPNFVQGRVAEVTFDAAGDYRLGVTVGDDRGGFADDAVSVRVRQVAQGIRLEP